MCNIVEVDWHGKMGVVGMVYIAEFWLHQITLWLMMLKKCLYGGLDMMMSGFEGWWVVWRILCLALNISVWVHISRRSC